MEWNRLLSKRRMRGNYGNTDVDHFIIYLRPEMPVLRRPALRYIQI